MISKERIARILLRIAVLLLLGWLCVMATSCGSKKKLVQKSQYSTEIATVEKVSEKQRTESVTKSETAQRTETTTNSKSTNFKGDVSDPTKLATVTEKRENGTTTRTYHNFTNVQETSQEVGEIKTDTLATGYSKEEIFELEKEVAKEAKTKASGSERIANVDIERGFPWWWFVIAVVIYGVISYFRKTMNPMRWFYTSKQ